jgi:calpain-15
MELFDIKEVNKAGIYMVTLYINGIETPVLIDDYLPTKYGKPAFASSNDNELWVILLEKAWAKLHGSYALTQAGLPTFASIHLSGVPSYDVEHKDIADEIDDFWF